MPELYIAHVVLYASFALYLVSLPNFVREVAFYVYLTALIILAEFVGRTYTVPITDSLSVSGHNLFYSGLLMTIMIFHIVEPYLIVYKHMLRKFLLITLFSVVLIELRHGILFFNPGIQPAHHINPSLTALLSGFAFTLLKIVVLIYLLTIMRKLVRQPVLLAATDITVFITILLLDGELDSLANYDNMLFPTTTDISARLTLAISFSLPLLLFFILYWPKFILYIRGHTISRTLDTMTDDRLMTLAVKSERLQQISSAFFQHSSEGVVVTDRFYTIEEMNPAFCGVTGLKPGAHIHFWDIIQIDDNKSILKQLDAGQSICTEAYIVTFSHTLKDIMASISPIFEENRIVGYVATLLRIDELKNTQKRLTFLADHDITTCLANRRSLEQLLSKIKKYDCATLIILDLDHFKDVNDSYGHPLGDEVLKEVAMRLQQNDDFSRKWFRIGGDEFACLVMEDISIEQASEFTGHCLSLLHKPALTLSNLAKVHISASAGITQYPAISSSPSLLLQHADAALYQAKQTKRGSWLLYSKDISDSLRERLKTESALREAVNNNLLEVYLQPQCDVKTGNITGAEALLRWRTPECGMIPTDQYIRLAEETGLIEMIGEQVLTKTCEQGRQWLDQGLPPIKLSVNVSPYQLRFVNLVEVTKNILQQTRFPPHLLELEITESTLMEREKDIIPQLQTLRDMGISIAIDDFGTGYSSLAHLKNFPFNTLKIDRSFIEGIPSDPDSVDLTQTIISLGHRLNFNMIAEGVETEEQLAFLRQNHCETYQGYLKSPAVEMREFAVLLERENTRLNRS
ncbi:putative bifunctional diguanylate cyclase/phosphodiesterase [Gynuella sunshinyii]|uniref:Putative signal transduction protein containing a membrane domain, an EAL and a GGDEF domain n=1 Tax=Gynuella sunshinyii YC6258 TaxID=1445510 RepID=A0A0C5VQW9_9GAMM|nr:EAL domain-containing protein [Gynuella sunshinyii]AJQ97017.1 putative signal transduction protein containing a membrane domain, an EAL and a GGDEF domain [Gynuella sunshinyii YC6258]